MQILSDTLYTSVPVAYAHQRGRRLAALALVAVLSVVPWSAVRAGHDAIDARLDLYRAAYPEIEFRVLQNSSEFALLRPLTGSLGKDVSNVDYAHPERARLDLVEVQEYRIAMLLGEGLLSATLFRTPDARVTKQPYTCLITLNPDILVDSPLAATRVMYSLDAAALAELPDSLRLDSHAFRDYSLDHELFHCVDGYLNGPTYPQTMDPLQAGRDRMRAEMRAEAYAGLAHLSRQPGQRQFLHSLATARTLNLLGGSLEHYTVAVLRALAAQEESEIPQELQAQIRESARLASGLVPDYAAYKAYVAAVHATLEAFGADTGYIDDNYPGIAQVAAAPGEVGELTDAINGALAAVRGE